MEKQAPGRAAAIRRFCLECMGGSHKEVAACTRPVCPLYAYRNREAGRHGP